MDRSIVTTAVATLAIILLIKSAKKNSDDDGIDVLLDSEYWNAFTKIATKEFGFMGRPSLSSVPASVSRIVDLAEELPSVFTRNDAVALRRRIEIELEQVGEDALVDLSKREKELVFVALVYIRHAYHQGDPTAPAAQSADLETEPEVLTRMCTSLGLDLGINPFLNLTAWVLLNWTTAAPHTRFDAIASNPNDLKMRFQWFSGAAGQTEQNFWRAFAISEMCATPIYRVIGDLLNALATNRRQLMRQRLDDIAGVLKRLIDIFRALVTPELIEINDFNKLQNTAHFGMASAGAGGFQLPFIIVLDALLLVDGNDGGCPFTQKLAEVRAQNIDEVQCQIKEFALKFVAPRARELKMAAGDSPDVGESYNKVVSAFVHWRSLHRSRAAKWLAPSLVTTGRSNDDMGGCVLSSFRADMDEIIRATRAQHVGFF